MLSNFKHSSVSVYSVSEKQMISDKTFHLISLWWQRSNIVFPFLIFYSFIASWRNPGVGGRSGTMMQKQEKA